MVDAFPDVPVTGRCRRTWPTLALPAAAANRVVPELAE